MENVGLRALSERISYLPATDDPLSSDVGIVRGDRFCWIFDVGSSEEALCAIRGISAEKNIVLSHFHEDHTGNVGRVACRGLYCGDYTRARLRRGVEVLEPMTFDDGVGLTIFPIPSTHSKGAVGLAVNDEYAFLGDAVYGTDKNGRSAYNANVLKEMLGVLQPLNVRRFLLSHDRAFSRPKEVVISDLKALYETRRPGEAWLFPEGGSAIRP